MGPWVFNATPLISLSRADRLSLLDALDGGRLVPKPVYEEVVVDGVETGYPDARRLERAVDDGRLDVVAIERTDLADRLGRNPALSDADVAVLTCAAARDGVAVMDEAAGREAAAVEGIDMRGTAYLVCLLAKRGDVGVERARETIDELLEAGWYCAPDLYARIVRRLESIAADDPGGIDRETE